MRSCAASCSMYCGAVARVRVAAQPLRSSAPALLLDPFEHPGQIARVVAGARHDLRPEEVGLALVVAAVFQHQGAETELRPICDDGAGGSADDGAGDGAGQCAELNPRALRLGDVRGAVTEEHVGELVRHHARHFTFEAGGVDHAAVDEHRPAGQGEGVDLTKVHAGERILVGRMVQLRWCSRHQAFADPAEVSRHFAVVDDRKLLSRFGRGLESELDVLLRRKFVLRWSDPRLSRDGKDGDERKDRARHRTRAASRSRRSQAFRSSRWSPQIHA